VHTGSSQSSIASFFETGKLRLLQNPNHISYQIIADWGQVLYITHMGEEWPISSRIGVTPGPRPILECRDSGPRKSRPLLKEAGRFWGAWLPHKSRTSSFPSCVLVSTPCRPRDVQYGRGPVIWRSRRWHARARLPEGFFIWFSAPFRPGFHVFFLVRPHQARCDVQKPRPRLVLSQPCGRPKQDWRGGDGDESSWASPCLDFWYCKYRRRRWPSGHLCAVEEGNTSIFPPADPQINMVALRGKTAAARLFYRSRLGGLKWWKTIGDMTLVASKILTQRFQSPANADFQEAGVIFLALFPRYPTLVT